MAFLVFCCWRIASSSCQASTRLTATASTSSLMPSSSRNLSKVEPLWLDGLRFFFAFIRFHLLLKFSAMLVLITPSEFQILMRSFLRLLHKPMEQNHPAFLVDVEKHSGNAILREARTHFVDAIAQRPAYRHANRPAEFDCLDVFANAFSIFRQGQLF